MYVKPVAGRTVRDPSTMQLLPEAGRTVPETSFWHRRVRDGDVVLADEPVPLDAVSADAPAATEDADAAE